MRTRGSCKWRAYFRYVVDILVKIKQFDTLTYHEYDEKPLKASLTNLTNNRIILKLLIVFEG